MPEQRWKQTTSRVGSASIRPGLGARQGAAGREGLRAFLHCSLVSPGPANGSRRSLLRVIHSGREQEEGDHSPASLPTLPARGAARDLDRALDYYCKVGSAAGSCEPTKPLLGHLRMLTRVREAQAEKAAKP